MRPFTRPGFDDGQGYRAAGACCDACAVGDACTGCDGPELGPAEGCQTGACPMPGRPSVAAGAVFDAGAAARQAMRVGARSAGEVAAGDADMDFFNDPDVQASNQTANALNDAARRRNNQTAEQWAALSQANRDRLIAAEFTRVPEAQRSAAWATLSPAQRDMVLGQIGRNAGLSAQQAAEFAERERNADYALVRGLVNAGANLVRELAGNSTREEIERIRANARTQAARYGVSTNAEGEFLNVFRQSQGANNNTNVTGAGSSSRSGGGALLALGALALLAMGGRR